MRISDWSSDVCSSDLEPLIEGTETSRTMLPESSTSYSQISSAPAAMTPSSKSVPLISNMPMKRLSLMGSEMSPSHNLNLIDPALPALRDSLALKVFLHSLGRSEDRRVGKEWFSTCRSRG